MTERWRVINEGNTIEIEYSITDPVNWEGEWIDTKFYDRVLNADINEASCIAAEDAKIPGSVVAADASGAAAGKPAGAGESAAGETGMGRLALLLLGGVVGAAVGWVLTRRRRA